MERRRLPRAARRERAAEVAARYGGIAHRGELRKVGVGRDDVRGEVDAGRWRRLGRQTVGVTVGELTGPAQWWHAMWESGAGAVLDGVAALLASGMNGFSTETIDIAIPKRNRRHRVSGVRLRHYSVMPPITQGGIPRVVPEHALLNAMQWALSDRIAALLLCLAVQQRIVSPPRLIGAFMALTRCRRRAFINAVIRDVCDGAHSLGELDVASLCRRSGLPPPTRQAVRRTPGGRVYLDLAWEDIGLVVEIDGGHHATALSPVLDALRQNDIVLGDETVLRVPVLGLRLFEERFMRQILQGYLILSARSQRAS